MQLPLRLVFQGRQALPLAYEMREMLETGVLIRQTYQLSRIPTSFSMPDVRGALT